ncbi:sulfate/molybdate ABC transporter ATP-binding protein [Agromyces archimandritae]|uniref:ATP-binding cassette domain-containing protein n=1 Tax=Agromyces archimandritae TaxID=2781962 RepID=A0A975FMS2_9MICO|nr:ATP-binding cassette domain-containing protein [Agromyces archimandritae]QTX03871.1 ATP-binding cassette domain-containing protein [Agromyces archimandritae]
MSGAAGASGADAGSHRDRPRAAASRAAGPHGLDARIEVHRGGFAAHAELQVAPGEVLALIGPNGAGKSTLLAALAGLVPLDAGEVRLGGRLLEGRVDRSDGASRPLRLPPERRRIGLLQQDAGLFPHLSVLENVAFGARAQGVRRGHARAEAARLLDAVGLGGSGGGRPAELSGGQRQRVAIARALAARPELLLLDEPFASLDVEAAGEIRALLAGILVADRIPAIVVSHDVIDAIVLAGRIAVVEQGVIVEQGTTHGVLQAPRTPFAASIAGFVLVPGTAADGVLDTPAGTFASTEPAGFTGPGVALFRPGRVRVVDAAGAAPASAPVAGGRPRGAEAASAPRPVRAPNRWEARIAALRPAPGGVRLRLAVDAGAFVDAELDARAAEELRPAPGARVLCTIDPADVALHPAAG